MDANQRHVLWLVSTVVVWGVSPRHAAAQADDKALVEPTPASQPWLSSPEPSDALNRRLEPPAPPFGNPGAVAISGTSSLGASYTTYGGSQASSLTLAFGPAFDVFVFRNLSLGLSGGVSYQDIRGYGADGSLIKTTVTSFSGAVRAGVNLPITSSLSLWPRLLVGYEWNQQSEQTINGSTTSISGSPLGYPTTTRNGPWAELVLPVTLHVAPHVFAGFGPSVFHEFSGAQGGPQIGGERTTVGAFLDVGGWFGGRDNTATHADAGDEPLRVPVRRFGSAHDIVISNAIGLQGFWTGYAGSNSTATTIAVTPGLDYFVAEHFSIGITVSGSYSSSTGVDSTTGAPVSASHHAFGVAPRIGADIPLGAYASFWPTVSIGLGEGTYAESEGTNSNDDSELAVGVSLYAPMLVHPTSHLFLGFGPSVSQDLTHSVTYPNSSMSLQNRSTTVGASLIVGGVL